MPKRPSRRVAERFTGETPSSAQERERYADAHLAPVRFEAQQYLQALEAGLAGLDVGSLYRAAARRGARPVRPVRPAS